MMAGKFFKAALITVAVCALALSACSGPQGPGTPAIDYQLDRAWANTAKGIRECQKADNALLDGNVDSARNHYSKALSHFETAVEHLAKAEDDAYVRAGNLLGDGDQQLQKAIDLYAEGDVDGAKSHYEKALEKYDEALDLIG